MKTTALALALLLSGAAVAQTTTTTETKPDVDFDVGVQPDGDLDVDADVEMETETTVATPYDTTTYDTDDGVARVESTTGHTAAWAGAAIVQPGNDDPERDARGIAVISAPAVVPAGFNGVSATAMGGPLVDPLTGETVAAAEETYPACTATVTDNCVQTYEVGRR